MTTTDIKHKLRTGAPTVGSWLQLPDSSVAEIMGNAGYDWVAVDLEHGRFSQEKLPDIFRALELGGTVPFARVAQAQAKEIKQVLDAGAQGVIFPMIETREQLEHAISWALYPPLGTRGVGYARTNLFGKNFERGIESVSEIVLVAQIEHVRALQELDDILQVEHLDGIMIGPYDLSASMGLTARFDHPDFVAVMDTIREKAKMYHVPMGLHVVQPDPEQLRRKIAEGYQFLAYSIDSVFMYRAAECPIIAGRNEK